MRPFPERRPGPRRGRPVAAACLALLLGPAALTGCRSAAAGSGGDTPASAQPRAAGPATPGGAVDGQVVEGTSYRFRLPRTPAFESLGQEVVDGGSIKRRWQYAIRAGGPYCVVVAVEQPSYTQPFPGSVLAVFEALNAEKTDHIVRNADFPPVAGAVGGVDQELEYVVSLDDGTTAPARLFQRQFLTPGKTLVSVAASSPQDHTAECHTAGVVASLEVTGRELASPPATS